MLRTLIFHTLGKFSTHLENFWPHLAWVRSPCPAAYLFHFASICDPEWLLTPSMTCILAGKLKSIQIAVHKSALKFINHVLVCSHHQSIVSSIDRAIGTNAKGPGIDPRRLHEISFKIWGFLFISRD